METPSTSNLSVENEDTRVFKKTFSLKKNRKNGLLIKIHHSVRAPNSKEKHYYFTQASFNETGEWLAVIDQPGSIFVFDLAAELYWDLPKVGLCSIIAFNSLKTDEILIGRNNGIIHRINSETGELCGCLKGHRHPLRYISFATKQPYCVTTTYEEAIVWDLRSNSQLHHLCLQTKISIKMVTFMPVTNDILGCFKDDSLHIWKFDTFSYLRQVYPDELKMNNIKSIAFTRNGRAMVVMSDAGWLAVISLDTSSVQKILSLPDVSGVKHIDFLPQLFDGGANKILVILSAVALHILNIETSTLLNTIIHHNGRINSLVCSPHGKYTACILQSGELNIHSTAQLLIEEEKKSKETKPKVHRRRIDKCQYERKLEKVHYQINQVLDLNRLVPLLKQHGEYPENYRPLIWKNILQLPSNHTAYTTLLDKGIHPAYYGLNEIYPLKNQSLLNRLKRLLSCLSHWCSLFSQVMYLPAFTLQFLKIFKYDQLVCFEVVVSVIVNWCQFWFEYFPFPPINVLTIIENVLVEHDPDLIAHFSEYQISSRIYAWPLLESAFSEVLSTKDWLRFWDHVLSNHPSFLLMAVAAFNIGARTSLLSMQNKEDFERFFSKESLNLKVLIKKTYHLMSETLVDNHPSKYLKSFQSLLKGCTYQEFTQYPKNMLENQIDRLNEMQKEEAKLIQEQKEILRKKMERETEKQEQKQFFMDEARLFELKEIYKSALREEEARITEHRRKIADLRHELKSQECQLMEEVKNKMLHQKTIQRKKELERLLADIDHKRVQDEMEIEAIEQETRNRYLEFLKKKKQLEMDLEMESQTPDLQYKALTRQQRILTKQLSKLRNEASSGNHNRQVELTMYTAKIDDLLQKVEVEIARDMAERQANLERKKNDIKLMHLESETKAIEQEVDLLLEELITHRENELCRKTSKLCLKENHSPTKNNQSNSSSFLNTMEIGNGQKQIHAALDMRRKIVMKQMKRNQCY